MVQKSILSFFSAAKAKKSEDVSESSTQEPDENAKGSKNKSDRGEDSPVKKASRGRARVIESDSEDEARPSTSSSSDKSDEEKENKKKNSPDVKNKKGTPKAKKEKEAKEKSSPVKKIKGDEAMEVDDEEEKNVVNGAKEKDAVEDAPSSSPSASASCETPKKKSGTSGTTVGFSPETVPPLRKTARKQMKRKSDSMESKQMEMLKKKKTEDGKSNGSEESVSSSQDADDKKESKEAAQKGKGKKGGEEKEIKKETEDLKEEDKEEVKKDIKKQTKEEAKKDVKKQTKEEAKKDVKKQTKEEAKKDVKKQTKEETKKDVKKQTKEEAKKDVKKQTKEAKKDVKKQTKEEAKKDIKKEGKEAKKDVKEENEEEAKKDIKKEGKEAKKDVKEENEEEPMEVDDSTEDKKEVKKEDKSKASTPSAKKPIHSFFAPRSPKKSPATTKANISPKKSRDEKEEEEEDQEEHCSSPVKKQKPAQSKKKKNVIESDSEEEEEEEESKVTSKEQKNESSKTKDKEEHKSPAKADVAQENDEKSLNDSPKAETKPAKTEKKPVVNPFAPKSAGAGDPGVKYNPGKDKYDPIKDAFWEYSAKVPYLALAKTFELIEKTSGRLKTIEMLANFLRSVIVLSPDDLLFCVYLCLNKVAPAFEGTELGVGDMILMRAIAQTSGRSVDKIKHDAEEKGDLGIVAEQSRSNQKLMFQPAKLTVRAVFEKLKEIAFMTGNSSQNKKMDKIKGMFVACRFSEARYLIRSLSGKLRIGLAEQSVLQAIAQACFLTPPGQEYPPEVLNAGKGLAPDKLKAKMDNYGLILKTTYCEFPSYDKIIAVITKEGLEELPKHCKLTPGVPLKPMLAHPTSGVSEVLKRFENAKFTCEFKYDGERAQIHMKEDGSVNIYSRNQEDNTTKYPDIISRLKNSLGENVKSCVIDAEAVAWDTEKKQILPFQILSTRKRKDANEKDIKVQVCVFPFDLLYLNGEALVREPFEKRRALLKENFHEVEGEFVFAKSMDSTNTEDIEEFLEESIKGDCEGLMVKTLDVDATYEIAKRSRNWLKLKKDYLDGVGDTIDAAVIGGYWGKGKRKGAYGCFLLACYDPDNEEFQSLCKLGTGFSEEQLQLHTTFLKEHIIEKPKSYYRYDSIHEPDVWFEAVQVWEVKCADLSISPHHKAAAGVVDPEKGISLRFPRFLRIREDKTPENATSSSQVADLYNNQAQIQNRNSTSNKGGEEEFY